MLDARFWEKYFRDYDLLNELIPYQELLTMFMVWVAPQPGQKILDAGCGTGNLAVLLSNAGAQITGLDFSEVGLEIYNKKIPSGEAVLHDLSHPLPFTDNNFDGIVSNNTLYTIPRSKREAVFKELYRVLKPGGKIVVANIVRGFNPKVIYLMHLREAIKRDGVWRTFFKAIRLLPPTVRIFYWNRLVQNENEIGEFDFFEQGEQKVLLHKAGFKNPSPDTWVYARQSIVNSAVK